MAMIFKWIIRMLPLLYIGLVWLQSGLFNPESVKIYPGLSFILEMGHLVLFAIFYVLIILALMTFGQLTAKKEFAVLLLSLLCALADEIHQHYIPYRSASLVDMLKNSIGIMTAWYLVRLVRSL